MLSTRLILFILYILIYKFIKQIKNILEFFIKFYFNSDIKKYFYDLLSNNIYIQN